MSSRRVQLTTGAANTQEGHLSAVVMSSPRLCRYLPTTGRRTSKMSSSLPQRPRRELAVVWGVPCERQTGLNPASAAILSVLWMSILLCVRLEEIAIPNRSLPTASEVRRRYLRLTNESPRKIELAQSCVRHRREQILVQSDRTNVSPPTRVCQREFRRVSSPTRVRQRELCESHHDSWT